VQMVIRAAQVERVAFERDAGGVEYLYIGIKSTYVRYFETMMAKHLQEEMVLFCDGREVLRARILDRIIGSSMRLYGVTEADFEEKLKK
jgi:hypothetical protein